MTAVSHAAVLELPALDGNKDGVPLVVYSSADTMIMRPVLDAFQRRNRNITVHYHELQTLEIYERVIGESDGTGTTADLAVSSAMDLQLKLANDGYAASYPSSVMRTLPA